MLRLPQLKIGPHLHNNGSRSPGHQKYVSGSFEERRKKYARKRKLVKQCRMVDPNQERQKHPSLPPSMMKKPSALSF